MSFPIVLRKKMGQNVLEIPYNSLLGFGIIINVNFLKWKGQLIHKFVILTILTIYLALPTNVLR